MASFAGPIGVRPQPTRPGFVAGNHRAFDGVRMGPAAVAPKMPQSRGPQLINVPYGANAPFGEISCNPYGFVQGKMMGNHMEMSKPASQRNSTFHANKKYGHYQGFM